LRDRARPCRMLQVRKRTEWRSSASVRFVHKRKADGVDESRRLADRPLSSSQGVAPAREVSHGAEVDHESTE
jgi:hypothetical protein